MFDKLDLCKLTAPDLISRGFDESVAKRVSADLLRGNVEQLSDAIGIELRVERVARWLIPGEGIRRSAGALADEDETLDQTLRELDEIRHPEGHAR
ncbi:MAG: hypothetical protein HYX69_18070 [Planctomycetia bacterium]|nr:hypothetical protein [Planctomycetia bacterium]